MGGGQFRVRRALGDAHAGGPGDQQHLPAQLGHLVRAASGQPGPGQAEQGPRLGQPEVDPPGGGQGPPVLLVGVAVLAQPQVRLGQGEPHRGGDLLVAAVGQLGLGLAGVLDRLGVAAHLQVHPGDALQHLRGGLPVAQLLADPQRPGVVLQRPVQFPAQPQGHADAVVAARLAGPEPVRGAGAQGLVEQVKRLGQLTGVRGQQTQVEQHGGLAAVGGPAGPLGVQAPGEVLLGLGQVAQFQVDDAEVVVYKRQRRLWL